jgi:hypothetical protein
MNARRSFVHLKDEVYRQMFRLEENRGGAGMGLALALLRAWIAADSDPEGRNNRIWLQAVSPICLNMIDQAGKANTTSLPCAR